MKKIYSIHDTSTDRKIALASLIDSSDIIKVENFLHEARITAKLEHPNILPLYNIGLDEQGSPYFTMKLVIQGESLRVILNSLNTETEKYTEQYSLDKLIDIFSKVCDAVAYAHSKNIIHLDLKPDNY